MAPLTGRRALVTGGGRGIGAAIVRRLVRDGASVVLNYRSDAQGAEELADSLGTDGATVVALRADVTDPDAIRDFIDRTVRTLGGLDILVSNAGVEHFGALEDVTVDDYNRVFDTNVRAQLFTTQAAAAVMSAGGRIVLMSSVSARIAVHHHSLYAASKAAVSALVLNLAPELADRGIAINALAPGGTDTGMAQEHAKDYVHPALQDLPSERTSRLSNAWGRLAEPDEIAAAAAFLVSPDAAFITGSTLAADGGRI